MNMFDDGLFSSNFFRNPDKVLLVYGHILSYFSKNYKAPASSQISNKYHDIIGFLLGKINYDMFFYMNDTLNFKIVTPAKTTQILHLTSHTSNQQNYKNIANYSILDIDSIVKSEKDIDKRNTLIAFYLIWYFKKLNIEKFAIVRLMTGNIAIYNIVSYEDLVKNTDKNIQNKDEELEDNLQDNPFGNANNNIEFLHKFICYSQNITK